MKPQPFLNFGEQWWIWMKYLFVRDFRDFHLNGWGLRIYWTYPSFVSQSRGWWNVCPVGSWIKRDHTKVTTDQQSHFYQTLPLNQSPKQAPDSMATVSTISQQWELSSFIFFSNHWTPEIPHHMAWFHGAAFAGMIQLVLLRSKSHWENCSQRKRWNCPPWSLYRSCGQTWT